MRAILSLLSTGRLPTHKWHIASMAPSTSFRNLFRNLAARKSSGHDEMPANRTPKRKSTLSLSFAWLTRTSPGRLPDANKLDTKRSKDATRKASATDDHGGIGSQVTQAQNTLSIRKHNRADVFFRPRVQDRGHLIQVHT